MQYRNNRARRRSRLKHVVRSPKIFPDPRKYFEEIFCIENPYRTYFVRAQKTLLGARSARRGGGGDRSHRREVDRAVPVLECERLAQHEGPVGFGAAPAD
jgi:hypothetical protein